MKAWITKWGGCVLAVLGFIMFAFSNDPIWVPCLFAIWVGLYVSASVRASTWERLYKARQERDRAWLS